MGISTYDSAVKSIVDEGMTDPRFCELYAGILKKMRSGFYGKRTLDFILQKHFDGYDMYDAFSFGQACAMIWSGKVVIVSIDVHETPRSDRNVKSNNRLMADLPHPFSGAFWGGTADCDGYVEWSKSVRATKFLSGPNGEETKLAVRLPVNKIPLEVGTTSGARTLAHLRMEHGVARWPYDCDELRIMVNVNPDPIHMTGWSK